MSNTSGAGLPPLPSVGLQGSTPLEAIAKLAAQGCKTALTETANDRSMGRLGALFLSIQMLAEGDVPGDVTEEIPG